MIPTRIFESPLRVLLLFCALALMMTWPLCRHLTTHLPQGMDDVWQNLWNFWWWKTALVDLHQSPYHTRHLFFPAGTDVAFHTHSEINQLAALPVTLLAGPVAAYNLATLASFVLAGFGAYLLAREITGDARAAVLAGLVFAFFPHHMEQTLDHLNLATIEFLPFVCLYLLRLVRRGGFANALKLGGALALNALGSWHYALMTVLFLPLLLAFELAGSGVPRRSAARGLMVAGAFAALVVAPFAWPMVHALAHGANYARPFTSAMGVDPLFLFLPSDHHPVLGGLTARLYRMKRTYANSGFLAYVGFIPLILAIAAWPSVRRDRRRLAWYLIAFSFLVLALGAHPRINGTPVHVTLPHALFAHIPVLRALRIANRFLVPLMLAIAVLAACGAAELRGRTRALFPVAFVLILFEYLWLPYPIQEVRSPPYLRALATESADGAVLDIPFCADVRCVGNQALQTLHGHPIAGGYISAAREPAVASLRSDPVLGPLFGAQPQVPDRIDIGHLRRLGFGTVVVHLDRATELLAQRRASLATGAAHYERRQLMPARGAPAADLDAIAARFAAAAGPPVYEDDAIRVFSLRPPPPPNVLLVTIDTLRADRLGSFGSKLRTPNLDQLAREGTLFENAACPMPATRPSHFSIMTSRYPRDIGVMNNTLPLPSGVRTLAETFGEQGYRTAAFVSVRLLNPKAGAQRGFEVFDFPQHRAQRDAEMTVPRVLKWLDEVDSTHPFFLWVHLFDPHMPYRPPSPWLPPATSSESFAQITWPQLLRLADRNGGDLPQSVLERARALYDGEVEKTDHWAGTLFDKLRQRNLLDRTIVVFTADHGECFDHGIFFEHYCCLYDGAAHVPLIIRYPPAVAAGERRRDAVEHIDLAPTALSLAGLPIPDSFTGRPLFAPGTRRQYSVLQHPLYPPESIKIRTERRHRLRSVAGEAAKPLLLDREEYAMRGERWKYIVTGADEELYDLASDPGETRDVAAAHADVLAEMRTALAQWKAEHVSRPVTAAPLSPRLREDLRALGYLQ